MIVTTRRAALGGMIAAPTLATPTLAALPRWRWQHGEGSVLLHDPSLDAGRRFAEAGRARGGHVVELAGDRIRLARQVLDSRPALLVGVSRSADALLVEEVAGEAGYTRVALVSGEAGGCAAQDCAPGWQALARMAVAAQGHWAEALADYAAGQGLAQIGRDAALPPAGRALGWVLARS